MPDHNITSFTQQLTSVFFSPDILTYKWTKGVFRPTFRERETCSHLIHSFLGKIFVSLGFILETDLSWSDDLCGGWWVDGCEGGGDIVLNDSKQT